MKAKGAAENPGREMTTARKIVNCWDRFEATEIVNFKDEFKRPETVNREAGLTCKDGSQRSQISNPMIKKCELCTG
jgi:hypothetical protein